jgi:thymidylate kinase
MIITNNRQKGILVCLIGMDGTGKSTLSKKLVENMNEHSIKTRYVWSGLEPLVLKPFFWIGKALFIPRHERHEPTTPVSFSKTLRKVLRNPLMRTAYESIFYLDYSLHLLWKVRIPMMRGECVVSDRYVYDVLINLAVILSYTERKMSIMLRAFERFLPKPSLVLLIDAPEEVAIKRKDDISSITYLSERRGLYLSFAKQYGFTVLNGVSTLPVLQSTIWDAVKEIL